MAIKQTDGSDLLVREFKHARFAKKFFFGPGWGWKLSLGVFAATICTLLLGHFTLANSIEITVIPWLRGPGQEFLPGPLLQDSYGYLLELNHGFFYLVLAPVFVGIGASFVQCAGRGISNLERCGYLGTGHPTLSVRQAIDRSRHKSGIRRIFGLPLCLILGVAGPMLYGHGSDYHKAASCPPRELELGDIESPFLFKWVQEFRRSGISECSKLDLFKADLNARLEDTLQPWILNHWSTLKEAKGIGDKGWDSVLSIKGRPLSESAVPDHFDSSVKIDFKKAADCGLIKFDVVSHTSAEGPDPTWPNRMFWVQFVVSSVLEGAFIGYVVWIGVKILWWLSVLAVAIHPASHLAESPANRTALAGRRRSRIDRVLRLFSIVRLRFRPLIDDPQKRYGLSELAPAYNRIAALLAISATVFALSVFSNNERSNFTSPAMRGSWWILAETLFFGFPFAFATLFLFPRWLQARNGNAIEEVRDAIKQSATSEDRASAEARKGVIVGQTTWPSDDKAFSRLIHLTVLLVILPFVLNLSAIPGEFQQALNVATVCKGAMRIIAGPDVLRELPSLEKEPKSTQCTQGP